MTVLHALLPSWVRFSLAIAAIGVGQSSAELWTLRQHMTVGLLGPPRRGIDRPRKHWVQTVICVSVLRTLASVLAACCNESVFILVAITVAALCSLAIQRWRWLGHNGADNVLCLFYVSLAVSMWSGAAHADLTNALFLSLYLTVVYGTAAISKLVASGWRSGESLRKIGSTRTFSRRWIATLLHASESCPKILSWAIMLCEVGFAAAPWSPPLVARYLLAAALLFHLMMAIVMGLNTFLPAFACLYPAAYKVSLMLYRPVPQ